MKVPLVNGLIPKETLKRYALKNLRNLWIVLLEDGGLGAEV